jgi:RsiW-degrading membrane proteinase PrsW (M82 family)
MILAALTLIGLYFVITRFVGLVTPSNVKASPLKAVGLIVVATTAGLIYARVVAWLDRNEKEPWRLMVSVLLLGAIAGFGVVNGVNRLLKSDLESLLEKPPLNEAEYHVLFPDSPRQVLEIDCNQPEEAIDVLRRMERFDEMEQLDGLIFVVSEGLEIRTPLIERALAQANVELRQTKVYTSSQNFFAKKAWPVVRDRLWDNVRPKRIAPLVEEATKGLLVLLLFIGLQREFDGPLDGIVYGALVGLGFALTENAVYMIGKDTQKQFLVRIIFRGLSGHATYTAFSGWGLGIARTNKNRTVAGLSPVVGFATAVIAHMLWNTFGGQLMDEWSVLMGNWGLLAGVLVVNGPFVALMTIALWLSWQQEDQVVREHLPADLYDPATYTARSDLVSARARYSAIRRAARTIGRQKAGLVSALHRTLIEIAFWFWYTAREGLDSNTIPELAALRRRVLDLRAQIAIGAQPVAKV